VFSAISKYIFLPFCPLHSMRTLALVLACSAFTGHARRVQDMQDGDGIENGAAKLTAREWELQNLARRRMGKMSNGELGLANLMSAARDPSMLNELAQMPAANQNFVELQKMLADPDFRKQAKNFAERMELSKDAAASSFLQDAKRVYKQIKTYIVQDHSSTLEQSQSGLDSLVEIGESTAQKRFTPASAFVPAAKSSLPRISRPRSTAVTQMSTGVADVDNVGITEPLGFFDPAGLSEGKSEAKIRFFREVELKHGRVAMLAALGFLLAESFHPLFGGTIDVPSYLAFQQTPLQTFWPAVVAAIAIPEIYSVFTFNEPGVDGEQWTMKSDGRRPGDFDFDPLGLKPEDPAELDELQTKEINNGRLAMIGIAGMVAQELVDGQKISLPF